MMLLGFPTPLSIAHRVAMALAGLVVATAAAHAAPPDGALPLSQIIAGVEAAHDIAWIEEVEWDNDGYWEIDLRLADGSRLELRLDPLTGAPR